MANHTLSCCIQKHLETNTISIDNLTVLYNIVKPCFHPRNNLSDVLSYMLNLQDDVADCSKQRQTIPETCKTDLHDTAVFTSFWIIVMIVATLGNLTVCLVIRKTRSLRLVITNHFIASLAISDLMVAVFLVPVNIYSTLRNESLCSNPRLCRYYVTMDNISFVASITNLVVITADRYIAITRPYRYQEIVTNRRSKIAIALVWIYAFVIGALTNVNWDGSSNVGDIGSTCWSQNKVYITCVFVAVFYIPTVLMGFGQGKMLLIAMRQSKMIASTLRIGGSFKETSEEEDGTALQPKHIKTRIKRILKEYRPVKAIMIVYGTFVMCWLPVSIISLVRAWCTDCITLKPWHVAVFVEVLPILNSTFNFFIYSLMNRQFRKALKKLVLGVIRHFN